MLRWDALFAQHPSAPMKAPVPVDGGGLIMSLTTTRRNVGCIYPEMKKILEQFRYEKIFTSSPEASE
tara:strand:- start:1205 stop:1405 length:201 start_codon:yes stop_codon:yes gene_type:complete